MARVFTPTDVYAFLNALQKQANAVNPISVYDTSTFISAAEKVLATGTENVINSLSMLVGRTLVAARPLEAKFRIINALDSGVYSNRIRKISLYSKDALPEGAWNTQLYTNLAEGYDNETNSNNSTKSMWEQNAPVALEMNFGGSSVWSDCMTTYKHALKSAFLDEASFANFLSGVYTEKANDMTQQKEMFARSLVLNAIGATYNMAHTGSKVNLTEEFNTKYGTSYTSEELRTTYVQEFLKFMVARFKIDSDRMTYRTANYHWSPAKSVGDVNYTLLRHTPKSKQRTMLYNPLFTEAKVNVLPEIFNPQYLDMTQFEAVDYWQNFNDPAHVKVKPAQTNKTSGAMEAGAEVDIPYVVGLLYDVDAIMMDFVLDDVETTNMESRKLYTNTWFHYARNGLYDPTENMILYYMAD